VLAGLWSGLRTFIPTTLAFVAVVVSMIAVPQVRTLFPTPSEFSTQIDFMIYTTATIIVYLIGLGFVLYPFLESKADRFHQPKVGLPLALLGLAVFGSIWLWPNTELTPSWWENPIRVLLFCGLIAWSLLLIAAEYLPAWASAQIFRSMLALTVFGVLGEVVWWCGENLENASLRIYSIGSVCLLGFVVVIIFAFVDRVQSKHPIWPVRLIFGVAVALALMTLLKPPTVGIIDKTTQTVPAARTATDEGDPQAAQPNSDHASDLTATGDQVNTYLVNWLGSLDQRIGTSNRPVIMVAASGGGSRAALFTALILESLKGISVVSNLQGDEDEMKNSVSAADRTVLISSVSGGSLATGCFTDPTYNTRNSLPRKSPKNFYQDTITLLIEREAQFLNKNEQFRSNHNQVWQQVLDECMAAKEALGQSPSKFSLSFLQSPLVDDMCTDFMAPLLRGVICPGRERGEAVTWLWRRQLFPTNTTPASDPKTTTYPPLWLCNTTHVTSGQPIVIGFPPMPQELARPPLNAEILYNFDVCQWRLERAEAVRLSANFPWGFEVASTPLHILRKDSSIGDPVHVIDGGVFDNSGITSIRSVVEGIQRISEEDPGNAVSEVRKQAIELAKQVVNKLHNAGVILLEIDSGAKPEPPGGATKLLGTALAPIHALNNATYFTSERTSSDNIQVLRAKLRNPQTIALRDRLVGLRSYSQATRDLSIENDEVDTFYHIKVTCNEQDNVMTAWALPSDDKARIFVRGMVAVAELKTILPSKFTLQRETFTSLALIDTRIKQIEDQLNSQPNQSGIEDQVKLAIASFSSISEIATQQRIDEAARQIQEYLYSRKAPRKQVAMSREIVTQMKENQSNKSLKLSGIESLGLPTKEYAKGTASTNNITDPISIKDDFSKIKEVLSEEKRWAKY
jgi:hypothetical protein